MTFKEDDRVKTTLYLPRRIFEVIAEIANNKDQSLHGEIIGRISRTLNEDYNSSSQKSLANNDE